MKTHGGYGLLQKYTFVRQLADSIDNLISVTAVRHQGAKVMMSHFAVSLVFLSKQ